MALFSTQATKFRTACNLVSLISFLWSLGETLMNFLIYRPFAYNWDTSINGTCGNSTAGYLTVTAFNFVIDLAIMLLPACIIWHLHMPTARRVGILIMFSLVRLLVSFRLPLRHPIKNEHFMSVTKGLHQRTPHVASARSPSPDLRYTRASLTMTRPTSPTPAPLCTSSQPSSPNSPSCWHACRYSARLVRGSPRGRMCLG